MLFKINYKFKGGDTTEIVVGENAEQAIRDLKGIYEGEVSGIKLLVSITDIQEHKLVDPYLVGMGAERGFSEWERQRPYSLGERVINHGTRFTAIVGSEAYENKGFDPIGNPAYWRKVELIE